MVVLKHQASPPGLTLAFFLWLLTCSLQGATYYVSPSGSDSNSGTSTNAPFLTPQKALSTMASGDTIYLRGGAYALTNQVKTAKAGTNTAYCNMFAYPGEQPVFNFSALPAATKGLYVSKDYWHVKGIEVEHSPDNGIFIGGGTGVGFAIIEGCVVHDCTNDGVALGSTSGQAHDTLVLNCDSYRNVNLASNGQDGDGFVSKTGCGPNNVFRGCRAWNNADDGWDFYDDNTNAVTLENCWSFKNGYDLWGIGSGFLGNGNGFKLGGAGTHAQHVLRQCAAFQNAHKGFDQNYNAGGVTLYNCTSFSNEVDYSFPVAPTVGTNVLKNNIAYLYYSLLTNLESGAQQVSNSWQGFAVSGGSFQSLDNSMAITARNSDYTQPIISFLHLSSGCALIDAGVNVGLPYNGPAPDLGAFETSGGTTQSPCWFDLSGCRQTNSGFALRLNGLTGHGQVILFASSNLQSWQPFLTNPPVTGSLVSVDTAATFGLTRRFYRAVEQ